ncbi:enoyl-CoA hydratase/isomerase family protein [Ectothiorhodospiraceae bacterium WFHF3C12]|nr:enoyl-CoA hydratase/isomerase family protein [Ectothiorhodospiraceae bacterium WFHF3C12]
MSEIELDISNHLAEITLNRPPVNALSVAMMSDLIDALRTADESGDVRAIIVSGAGTCFSAGVDLREQLAALENDEPGPGSRGLALYEALLGSRKPTIAAINGPALGAGLGIAASCCILVASETATVGLPEIQVGMLGGARHAMRILGHSTVNRMLLTGVQLSARELYARNVVEACLPGPDLLPYARGIAAEIADKDPTAVELARRALARVEDMSVLEGYALEMHLADELGRTPAARKAMESFLRGGRKESS